jgi:hypothetical protein
VCVDHKRPLLAFIVVALICGMVIGHALATAAMPALGNRSVAIVQGIVFQAAPAEPTDGQVFSPVAAADPVTVVPAIDTPLAPSDQRAAAGSRHVTKGSPSGTRHVRWQQSRDARGAGALDPGQHGHGKQHAHGHGRGHGHGQPDFVLSLRWR